MSPRPFLTVRSGHPTATELAALVTVLRGRRAAVRRVEDDTAAARAPWIRRHPNPRGWRG